MSAARMLTLIVLGLGALVAFNSAFIVPQTSSALVFQLGRLARPPIANPGLYFKVPFIETVVLVDNRVLDNDLQPQTILASDQKNLVVDAFTRYRITDPLKFYQTLNNLTVANQTLERIVNDRVRSVLAGADAKQIIDTNRAALMERIQDEVNRETQERFGLKIVDVRLTRVDLPRETTEAVFRRMTTERQREAEALRAQGAELALTIRSKADAEVQVTLGNANRAADELRGRGEAEKTRILADVFRLDPEFSAFFRSMQAYETSFQKGDTRMILSPDSPFFRYFNPTQAGPRR